MSLSSRRGGAIARTVSHPHSLFIVVCLVLLGDALRLLHGIPAKTPQQIAFVRADEAISVAATIALIALGAIAARRGGANARLAFAIGALAGLVFFARTLGLALADPGAIGWLIEGGDRAQHYSGWAMFRSAPWSWPPGRMPELWYPVGTAIVYTDSLPLLALLLKPFSTWLPEPFQYIGLWFLINCTLQGGFGALLVRRISRAPAAILAGAALFVFAPLLISRIGHDTLTTQWLLLASIWAYFRAPSGRIAVDAWPWWTLATIAALVHPYLAAMVLALHAAYAWKLARAGVGKPAIAAMFAATLALAMLMEWLSGAMTIRAADSSGGIAFGIYSLNPLAFVNPMNYSGLLPNLPSRYEQYEGFAYLGAGVIALALVALVDRLRGRRLTQPDIDWTPLFAVALVTMVFALGTVVTIGPWTLIDLPLKSRVLGLFRACGRFVWVFYYVAILVVVAHALRRFPRHGAAVLALALLVQMIDLAAAHGRVAMLRLKANAPFASLDDPRWEALAAGRRHLTLLPPPACGKPAVSYEPALLFAADHELTVNTGYLARWNQRATGRYCEALHDRLARGDWSADDIYVLGADWKARFLDAAPAARCEVLNGHDVCVFDNAPSTTQASLDTERSK